MAKPTKRAAKRTTRGPKGKETATRTKRFKRKPEPRQDMLPGVPPPAPVAADRREAIVMAPGKKQTLRITGEQEKRVKALMGNTFVFVTPASETDVIRAAFSFGLDHLEKLGRDRANAQTKFPT